MVLLALDPHPSKPRRHSGCLAHGRSTSEFITRCTPNLVNKLHKIGKFTDSQRAGVEFRLSKLGGRRTRSERELQVNAVAAAESSMVAEAGVGSMILVTFVTFLGRALKLL